MGSDEHDILDFLKRFETFVSPMEIAKKVGGKRRFMENRDWARPVLYRLGVEGLIESNEYGHFRLKPDPKDLRKRDRKSCSYALGDRTYVLDDNLPFLMALDALRPTRKF
jgi:hypothetical protein